MTNSSSSIIWRIVSIDFSIHLFILLFVHSFFCSFIHFLHVILAQQVQCNKSDKGHKSNFKLASITH